MEACVYFQMDSGRLAKVSCRLIEQTGLMQAVDRLDNAVFGGVWKRAIRRQSHDQDRIVRKSLL